MIGKVSLLPDLHAPVLDESPVLAGANAPLEDGVHLGRDRRIVARVLDRGLVGVDGNVVD